MRFPATCIHLKNGCESWSWTNQCCHPTIYVAAAVGGKIKLWYPCAWGMRQYRFYFWDVPVFHLSHTLYLWFWADQVWDSCDQKGRPPQIHMVLWLRECTLDSVWQQTQLRTSVVDLINEKLSYGEMDFTSWVNYLFSVNLFSCFGMWGKMSPICASLHSLFLSFFFLPSSPSNL